MLDEFGEPLQRMCAPCLVGFHAECTSPDTECCCGGVDYLDSPEIGTAQPRTAGGVGPRVLNPSEITDPTSTGRKRAAQLYPIFDGMVCEWAGLKYAGGGVVPIIGCDWNLIFANTKDSAGADLHHGPSKSTINNSPGNVHRICKSCHHTWHSKNDVFYGKVRPKDGSEWLPTDYAWVPHDPFTEADSADLADANSGRKGSNPRASEGQIAATRLDRQQRKRIYSGVPPQLDDTELL